MFKKARIVLSVAASFAMVTMLLQSYRQQRETNRQLLEVQQALSHVTAASPLNTQPQVVPVILEGHDAGSATAMKRHNLDEILSLGWNLIDERNPQQAAEASLMFKEGITNIDPKNAELYNGLGRASLIAGKPCEAIAAWRKGLELSPTFSDMQSGIGWGYWWLNDPSRAKDAWEKALSMDPQSLDAWSAMAWIDLALGKYAEAKRGFGLLVCSDPKRNSWVMGLAMARAGNNSEYQITQFFKLPSLDRFSLPLTVDPAQGAQHP